MWFENKKMEKKVKNYSKQIHYKFNIFLYLLRIIFNFASYKCKHDNAFLFRKNYLKFFKFNNYNNLIIISHSEI